MDFNIEESTEEDIYENYNLNDLCLFISTQYPLEFLLLFGNIFYNYLDLRIVIADNIDNEGTIENESLQNDLELTRKPITVKIDSIEFDPEKNICNNCTICMEEFKKKEMVSSLDCNHQFHETCIREWCCYKPCCPNCRKTIHFFQNE